MRAAFDRVAAAGFEGLRLRDVAADVGIDHTTIHHHIATKQRLVEGVADLAIDELRDSAPQPGEPFELATHLSRLAHLIGARPQLFLVTAELDLRGRRDEAVAQRLKRHEDGWRRILTELLAGGGCDPAIQTSLADLVIATVKGVRLEPVRAPSVLQQLEDLVSRAIDGRP